MRNLALAILAALWLSACGDGRATKDAQGAGSSALSSAAGKPANDHIRAVRQMVLGAAEFGDAKPAIKLPRDERPDIQSILTTSPPYPLLHGECEVSGRVRPNTPGLVNLKSQIRYDGNFTRDDAGWLLLVENDFIERVSVQEGPNAYICQVETEALAKWKEENPSLHGKASDGSTLIALASRENVKFDYETSYETEMPMKGTSPVVSLRFSYDLRPTVRSVQPNGRGTGAAKAYLDRDSGSWTFLEFSVSDPDLILSPLGAKTIRQSAHGAGDQVVSGMPSSGKGDMTAPDLSRSIASYLPPSLNGLQRTEVSSASAGGRAGAEAIYARGDARVVLSITDLGSAGLSLATMQSASADNGRRFERISTISGRLTSEVMDRGSGSAEYSVLAGKRYLIKAEGTGVSLQALKSAVAIVNPAALEGR